MRPSDARRIAIRAPIVDGIKTVVGCQLCGFQSDLSYLFDFHHLRQKRYPLVAKQVYNRRLDSVVEEVLRCIVVCANCHRWLHYNDNYKYVDIRIEYRFPFTRTELYDRMVELGWYTHSPQTPTQGDT